MSVAEGEGECVAGIEWRGLLEAAAIGDEALDLGFLGLGMWPDKTRAELPVMPKGRYDIMLRHMPRVGTMGLDMMLRTCTIQTNLDYKSEADMVQKFRVSLALQPLGTALFANSPFLEGKPNSFLSYRSHIWSDTDPARTGMLPFVFEDGMGFERYVDYALDVPMYFVKRGDHYHDVAGASFREVLNYHLISASPYLVSNFWFADGRVQISPQLRVSIDRLELAPQTGSTIASAAAATPPRTLFYPEPRILIRAALLPERLWLVGGLGLYHQAPQGSELSPRFGNPYLQWQSGVHYVLGSDVDLRSGLHLELALFYKDLRSLVVQDEITAYNNDGLGRVYGGELLVRQPLWHNLTGFVAYTLSRSERRDSLDQPWRVYRFDQTHILTVLATYKLPWGLDIGARFRYVTGNPTTRSAGSIRDANYQFYDSIDGELLSFRLPDFHQLDLRVDKTFTMKRWRLGLYLEVQNVYNRKNAESLIYGGRQLYQEGRVTGLPIFPNLGVRGDF